MAICREITLISAPFGDIHLINSTICGMNHIKIKVPNILKIVCANAVLLAFTDAPIEANKAVIVVPILSPNIIGIAPFKPIKLVTPSAMGVDAKFCKTAIVAELDCTTTVITIPNTTPKTGMSETFTIKSANACACANGFITADMVFIPTNKIPKPNAI